MGPMDGLHILGGKVRMTRVRGRSHIKMDDKGRISLPATFRSAFAKTSKLYITNSLYQGRRFLDLYSSSEWQKLESRISKLPSLKSEVQAFQRFYLSSAEECELDSQGRMLIPAHLREYAGLQSDVVLVGVGHKVEMWSADEWSPLFGQLEKDYERVVEVLSDLEESKDKNRSGRS